MKTRHILLLIFLLSLSILGFSQDTLVYSDTGIGYTSYNSEGGNTTIKLVVNVGDTINVLNKTGEPIDGTDVDTNGATAVTDITVYSEGDDTIYSYIVNKNSSSIVTFPGDDAGNAQLTILLTVLKDTSTAGIDNISSSKINTSIFPNPAKTNFTVKSDTKLEKIEIISENGQIMETENLMNSGLTEYEMNVSGLPDGLYFVRINDVSIQKIVVITE